MEPHQWPQINARALLTALGRSKSREQLQVSRLCLRQFEYVIAIREMVSPHRSYMRAHMHMHAQSKQTNAYKPCHNRTCIIVDDYPTTFTTQMSMQAHNGHANTTDKPTHS